jgi:aconitate hydratase
MKLAEFTLSRKDPGYVARAKESQAQAGSDSSEPAAILAKADANATFTNTGIGSVIYANKPGDGSAREQAASCQRVLGGAANICIEYATKRYRSNLINWGMLPFTMSDTFVELPFELNDYIYIKDIKKAVESGADKVDAVILTNAGIKSNIKLDLLNLTAEDRDIILSGCLMNYYRDGK